MITVQAADEGALERAAKMLQGINGGLETALKRAATRSSSHLRTQSTKTIRERYAINAADVKGNERISVKYSYDSGVQATVSFAGSKIPLAKYQGSSSSPSRKAEKVRALTSSGWKQVHPSNPAKGHQLKGTAPVSFPHAFFAQMGGHKGIWSRSGGSTGKGTDELQEIMGSSVPQMLGNEEVQENLAKSTMDKFEERLDHEVLAILNGWGR